MSHQAERAGAFRIEIVVIQIRPTAQQMPVLVTEHTNGRRVSDAGDLIAVRLDTVGAEKDG